MADRYKYANGDPVIVKEGEHGMNVRMTEDSTSVLQSLPEEGEYHAQFEVQNYSEVDPIPVVSRQTRPSTKHNTINKKVLVEFISFGHSHIYPIEDYPKVAPLWRDRLLAESRELARSIQGDQAIAREFLESDGSLGAWMTHGIAAVIDVFKRRPVPKPEEFDPLSDRVWKMADKVKAGTAADYELLHEAGLEFMHIRHEQDLLHKKMLARLNNLISAAEAGQTGAEETEKTAFWILDLYGQAVCKDPASLFAYRFGVLIVRAGARGAGALIADNSAQAAFQQTAAIMRAELPKDAKDLMLAFLKKGFSKMGPMETFAEKLIGMCIDVFFITLEFVIFDLDKLPPEQRAHSDSVLLEKLATQLAKDIVDAIAAIVVTGKLQDLPADSPARKLVERLGAVIPAVINSSIEEVMQMKQHAEAEKRTFSDVFTSEGGWALIRIIREGGKAFLEAPIKARMGAAHADDVKYYRALILSIRLRTASVDASRVKGNANRPAYIASVGKSDAATAESEESGQAESSWNKKLPPPVKSGPDENGNIGIAKLKPVAGEAAPEIESSPPKPARAKRNRVKKTPESNKTPTPKEMVERIGPAYSWDEIEAMTEAGQIRDKAHVLAVIVRNPKGKTIKEWYEVSELDVALGSAKLLGHTEQKALARISLMELKPGSRIIFVGHLQPCNLQAGCSTVMQDFVNKTRTPIEYRAAYSDDDTTHVDFDPDEPRMTKKEREALRKQQ